MRRLFAILTLLLLPLGARAADPNVKRTIEGGLTFLAKNNLAWKTTRKCFECHHAPFTLWALNEGKKQGYAVDEKALAEMTGWVVGKDYLAMLVGTRPKREQVVLNQAPLLLALGLEAGSTTATRDGLKQMLASVLNDQDKDGSWKLGSELRLPTAAAGTISLLAARSGQGPLLSASALFPGRIFASPPIGASPDGLTALALLALSDPKAPDLGKEGKAAREKGLRWLRSARPEDELQSAALRLILWRRLARPATEWGPLVKQIRSVQNADGGWSQTKPMKSDAYATGQALYALAEAGVKPADEAVRRAQAFLAKTQRPDGSWAMASRALLPGGAPPKNLGPITHAGSAWAVIGLAHSSPAVAKPGPTASK